MSEDGRTNGGHRALDLDPTKNVIALNDAANNRQDDLREAAEKYTDMRFQYIERIAELRSKHSHEMRVSESDRVNSIRQVDIVNSATEATRALQAINTLAQTAKSDAEKLASLVNSTAQTNAVLLTDTVARIEKRIGDLERSSYEGAGKERVSDPLLAGFMKDMKMLLKDNASGSAEDKGMQKMWGYVFGGIMLIIAVVGFLWPHSARAEPPPGLALDPMVDYRFCGLPPRRDPDGSIHRSSTVRAAAQRAHPCPATGLPKGACPGWAIDHDWPLVAGGCDAVFNMTWMPLSIKSCAHTPGGPLCKDRYEELIFATPMVIVK